MADPSRKPRLPAGLAPRGAGRRLWRAVVGVYELRPDELAHLEAACRLADRAERLHDELDDAALTVAGSREQPVAHPLAGEWRATLQLQAHMLDRIALPDEADTDAVLQTARSNLGRRAARARWG